MIICVNISIDALSPKPGDQKAVSKYYTTYKRFDRNRVHGPIDDISGLIAVPVRNESLEPL